MSNEFMPETSHRYEIREKIGQGGVGAVFKAFDTQLKREVALKRLVASDYSDGTTDQLFNEATLLSSLQHPNIVTVYDVGQDAEGAFVVMELLKGETLDETIKRGALTEKDFATFVGQTMEALIAAHSHQMIHRDIKPGNLMIIWLPSGKFQVKILDFGLAKFGNQPSKQTVDQEDAILGSIFFMAPEQFERVELDGRTDLYALGSIYYYALTTKYPFTGETPPQVMAAHLRHRVKDVALLRPDLPKWMCQWVMWLIERKRDHRPSSAKEAFDYFSQESVPASQIPVIDPPAAPPQPAAPPTATSRLITAPTRVAAGQAQPQVAGTSPVVARTAAPPPRLTPTRLEKKKSPFPTWALVTLPILLIFLLAVFFLRSKEEKGIKENNEWLTSFDPEAPTGGPDDIRKIIAYMQRPGKTKIEENNSLALVSVLHKIEGEGIDEALIAALKETKGETRAHVIGALSAREVTGSINRIAEYLKKDYTSEERTAAVLALQFMGGTAETADLVSALRDVEDMNVRRKFEGALYYLSAKGDDDQERQVRRLQSSFLNAEGEFRDSLRRVLAKIGGALAWEMVSSDLNSTEPAIRQETMRALTQWRGEEPLEQLVSIAESAPQAEKELAIRTIISVLDKENNFSAEKKLEVIERIFAITTNRSNKGQMLMIVGRMIAPSAADFIQRTINADPSLERQGEAMMAIVSEGLNKLSAIEEFGKLEGKMALLENVNFDASANVINDWTSRESRVRWPVRFDQPGQFAISLLQAVEEKGGSEFRLMVGSQSLEGKTVSTGSRTRFEKVLIGEITITSAGHYVVSIVPAKLSDFRLMELRHIEFQKVADVPN